MVWYKHPSFCQGKTLTMKLDAMRAKETAIDDMTEKVVAGVIMTPQAMMNITESKIT